MPKYAMAIDLESCIGCHACTIACKSEHDIPIGVWRCWVKEVEKGAFPNTKREFLPVLCNQCDDAPCQNICPTKALFRRSDGIVDLDADWCIGCKSCIAACPYDQLFIDPNTMTAEKCNFCANRLEVGLEPACVVVCPTQCRVFGDIEDANSKIIRLTTQHPFHVRKPEYNTSPNIYYLEGSRQLLDPTEAGQSGIYKQGEMDVTKEDVVPEWENKPGESRTVYDTFHEIPWDSKIITYLMTKGVSTGLLLISLFLWAFGFKSWLISFWMPALSGILLAITGGLLITDLKRPERFYYIMLRSNWGSWMAWGTWFIALDGLLTFLWVVGAMVGTTGFMDVILWPTIVTGALASLYTGFFFAQASARDLWKGSENTLDIGVQSGLKGVAVMLLFATLFPIEEQEAVLDILGALLVILIFLHLLILAFSTLAHRFGSVAHERAIHLLTSGAFKNDFWGGAIVVGCLIPLFVLWVWGFGGYSAMLAGVIAMTGACLWDKIWVKAGQAVPLS